MAERDPHRDLLARATVAFERQTEWFERDAESHERLMRRMDERDAEAREHREQSREEHQRMLEQHERMREQHERMMGRMERSENLFVEAIGDLDATINANQERNNQRLDEIGAAIRDVRESIRAHTEALLSILDRLGPAPG